MRWTWSFGDGANNNPTGEREAFDRMNRMQKQEFARQEAQELLRVLCKENIKIAEAGSSISEIGASSPTDYLGKNNTVRHD